VIVVGGRCREGGNQEVEVGAQIDACDTEDGRRASEAGGGRPSWALMVVTREPRVTRSNQVRDGGNQCRLEGVSNFNN
jgi:hypothetical protein